MFPWAASLLAYTPQSKKSYQEQSCSDHLLEKTRYKETSNKLTCRSFFKSHLAKDREGVSEGMEPLVCIAQASSARSRASSKTWLRGKVFAQRRRALRRNLIISLLLLGSSVSSSTVNFKQFKTELGGVSKLRMSSIQLALLVQSLKKIPKFEKLE